MKNNKNKLLLGSCLLTMMATTVSVGNVTTNHEFGALYVSEIIVENEVQGIWQYTVENAPPEYSKGVIIVKKENTDYEVAVQLAGGSLEGSNVLVEGAKLSFEISVEGTVFKVELTVDGDRISGQSSSYEGTYTIKGNRVNPK